MSSTRPSLLALALGSALMIAAPRPAAAQIGFGVQVARAADVLGGQDGIGARLALGVPALPVSVALHGDWFRTACPGDLDCSYRTASADLRYRLAPVAPLSPVLTGGWTARWIDVGDGERVRTTGMGFGVGLDVSVVFDLFVEARYELIDPEDQWVVRLGVLF